MNICIIHLFLSKPCKFKYQQIDCSSPPADWFTRLHIYFENHKSNLMMFKNVMALKLFHFIMLRYLHVCALSNFDKQSFSVIRNSSFVISLTTFRFEYVSSVVGCASLCTIEGSCCTASYDRTSGICSLDSCCYPTKELSVVRTFIRKRTMNGKRDYKSC